MKTVFQLKPQMKLVYFYLNKLNVGLRDQAFKLKEEQNLTLKLIPYLVYMAKIWN